MSEMVECHLLTPVVKALDSLESIGEISASENLATTGENENFRK